MWGFEGVNGRGDREIARIAELQRGLVHRKQLLAGGISPEAIKHRIRIGSLHPQYRDVYLVGRPHLQPLAAAAAAVMHLEGRGVLSHRSAAGLWGIADGDELPVEISIAGADIRSRPGLIVHRPRCLEISDVRSCRQLPVTSPARTLLDLAGTLAPLELEAAVAIARRRGLLAPAELDAAISRSARRKNVARLRELVRSSPGRPEGGAPRLTRSGYERKLLRLIESAGLAPPLSNAKVEGMEVDLLWPEQKLIVEFDGFAYHSDRAAFERDRRRDQRLTVAGYRVLRLTARQLDASPLAVIATIAMALARCAA